MTTALLKCAKAPCKSCPYRKDVPSGVWAAEEYDKLPVYDGPIGDQLLGGAHGPFMCHQKDGRLCAGWVGTHGPHNLAAMRLSREIDPSVWEYITTTPLFSSGGAAAAHGNRSIKRPGSDARQVMARIVRGRGR